MVVEPKQNPTPPHGASRIDQVLALVRLGIDAAVLIFSVPHETPVEAARVIAQYLQQQWATWIRALRAR